MKRKNKLILTLCAAVGLYGLSFFGFAQAETAKGVAQQEVMRGKELNKGRERGGRDGEGRERVKEELLRLKNEDPERFKQVITERQGKVKQKLEQLRQDNPEKYSEVMQKIRQGRLERLKKLRQEDPEKFRELIGERRSKIQERLETLKTENPQSYERIMEYKKKLEGLRRLRQEDPEKFREYLNAHPRLRQRLENTRDRNTRGDFRGRRQGIRDNDTASCPDRAVKGRASGPKYRQNAF